MASLAYEDPRYYNNYHVLESIFVFPHLNKVTFLDSEFNFTQIQHHGVDFDWYKNDEQSAEEKLQESTGAINTPSRGQKKFVILKNSTSICFDNGRSKIQVYRWEIINRDKSDPS